MLFRDRPGRRKRAQMKNLTGRSSRVDTRIGLEARRRDAGERAFLVVVRRVAGDPDRPEDVTAAVLAAGIALAVSLALAAWDDIVTLVMHSPEPTR